MEYKIIQIIPTFRNIDVTYHDDSEKKEDMKLPVVCLALIEYEDDIREVKPMDMDEYGEVSLVSETGNIKHVKCCDYNDDE